MKKKNNDLFYGELFGIEEPKLKSDKKIYSVQEINKLVKDKLEDEFSEIWIEGEISNSKLHSSGHFYFSLKDEDSQIKAIMFKGLFSYLKFVPENGMKVLAKGNLTCFIGAGNYQINVVYMEPKGIGGLQLAFEQLKQKLAKEGLFDEKYKKSIPMLPQKIGIVTSPTGAAIRDILSVINRRYANVHVILYPVNVQGDSAKFEIKEAIEYFNENFDDIDVLLVGRGGGSIEDLWAFNEEIVARAIFDSKIPIISCVGHEIDFVIADFVADLRAPTPSVAAEIVVKNKVELVSYLEDLKNRIDKWMLDILDELSQTLDYVSEKTEILITKCLDKNVYKLGFLIAKLENLSPTKIIEKGYAVIKDLAIDKIVDIKKIKISDKIKILSRKTELVCEVLEVNDAESK